VGIIIGALPPGPHDAITDVEGVLVGHRSVWVGDSIRTGVTAILPHGGNLFQDPVRAAIVVGNGFGKLVGLSQVQELGEIETPILLTGTLSVFRAADALIDTLLRIPANREVRSINPVVGETNDGYLSDIRARPIAAEDVRAALRNAHAGLVREGSVGAGSGTRALGWKGGIGTASRRVADTAGGYTVGVLVQTNFGGSLTVSGVPVGALLRQGAESTHPRDDHDDREGGSVMIVLATDAPLAHLELERVARRALYGVARAGSSMAHGSGDYVIAFSTDRSGVRGRAGRVLSALFVAAMDATEEAVVNSLLRATTVVGYRGHRSEAIPVDAVVGLLRERGALKPPP